MHNWKIKRKKPSPYYINIPIFTRWYTNADCWVFHYQDTHKDRKRKGDTKQVAISFIVFSLTQSQWYHLTTLHTWVLCDKICFRLFSIDYQRSDPSTNKQTNTHIPAIPHQAKEISRKKYTLPFWLFFTFRVHLWPWRPSYRAQVYD